MEGIRQVGQNIKRIRVKMKLSQLDLAAVVGCEEPTIWRIEKGKTNPTLKTLLKISSALGVPPSFLLRGLK